MLEYGPGSIELFPGFMTAPGRIRRLNPANTTVFPVTVYTVPGGYRAIIPHLIATYAAAIGAGNRRLFVQIKDPDGNVLWQVETPVAITASQSIVHVLAQGAGSPTSSGDTTMTMAMFAGWLDAGYSVVLAVTGNVVNDAINSIFLTVLELLIGATGFDLTEGRRA